MVPTLSTLFVSDIHLEVGKPHLTEIFVAFLRGRARQAKALYLLGDIFEVWIGDDDPSPLVNRIEQEIRAVADSGTAVFFMHGNRDFLLRKGFADRAGMLIIDDPTTTVIGGVPTVLGHGDIYCTDDLAYQNFRRKSRDPAWQAKVLGWSLLRRRLTARVARFLSKRNYQKKLRKTGDPNQIADVSNDAIRQDFERFGVARIIHGHTHRPAVHQHELDGRFGERIVLSDWRDVGEALEVRDDGTYERHTLTTTG